MLFVKKNLKFGYGLRCFNSVTALLINKKSGVVSFGNNVILIPTQINLGIQNTN